MRLIDEQIVMLMPSTKWVLPLFNAASLFNMMHTPVSFFLGGLLFFLQSYYAVFSNQMIVAFSITKTLKTYSYLFLTWI